MSQISQIKKIYHAAIYVRLSKEDGAVASHEKTESNSIANQKSLIRDFLENKNDIEVVQEYVDDGFSGSNFERPAFQMMFFNDTATTEIYTLSLHDALPIYRFRYVY